MGNALSTLCDETNKLVAAQHLDMPSALLNSVRPCSIDFHRGEAGPQELQVARVEAEVLVIFCAAACLQRVEFHSQPHYQLLRKCHTKACLLIQEQNIRGDQPKEQSSGSAEVIRRWAIMATLSYQNKFWHSRVGVNTSVENAFNTTFRAAGHQTAV